MIDGLSSDVLRVWARDAAAFADVLADQDPSWGSQWFSLAGGRAVLCGAGMYVNHALAAGLDGALSEVAWQAFEGRCAAVGVVPAFEVSPATAGEVVAQLVDRGYALDGVRAAMFHRLDGVESLPDPRIVIEPANGDLLELWHGERLVVVRDSLDGRPVGCASLTVTDRIATLGGMPTLPRERGRGVQSALIAHRLRRACGVSGRCGRVGRRSSTMKVSSRAIGARVVVVEVVLVGGRAGRGRVGVVGTTSLHRPSASLHRPSASLTRPKPPVVPGAASRRMRTREQVARRHDAGGQLRVC